MITLYDSVTATTKTASDLGFAVIIPETELPGTPFAEEISVPVAGRHGAYDFGGRMNPVAFDFHCVFASSIDTQTQVQVALRAINAFILDGWGYPKELELTLAQETDKHYNVRYGGGSQKVEIAPGYRRRFHLPLIAHDPIAYSTEVSVALNLTTSPQAEVITVTSGLNVPLTLQLDNEGSETLDGFSFKTYELALEWTAT